MGGKIVKNKKSELNYDGIRVMTPNEWGKLQGFIGYGFKDGEKEKFSFPKDVSVTQQYKLFGNSVSIPVMKRWQNICIKDWRNSMQFNRGEWSELYALLELLDNQDLKIVDDNLEIIDDSTFRVIGLYVQNNNNEYYFDIKGINVDVLKNNKVISNVKKNRNSKI